MNVKTNGRWGKRRIWLGIVLIAAIFLIALISRKESKPGFAERSTYTVNRENLVIDVLESGSVESSDAQVIKCEVEGRTTIISIVPEGTILTDKDVEEERVLVELDSADLRERETQQEITVQTGVANLADASASYEIQIKQNESNLKQGELKVKFAGMDLEKYLGEKIARRFLDGEIEMDQLVESSLLGGEALQKRRNLENAIDEAQEELARAEDQLDWTKKLHEKGYVTRNDLLGDQLAKNRRIRQEERSRTDLDLFKRYEFPKEVEKLRSDYEEAERELDRIKAKNRSEISKAEARLQSNQANFRRQSDQLKKIRDQIDHCTIVATQPGLVVYGGSNQPWRSDRIEEGAQVRERQEILKIPNTDSVVVNANVHESVVARVHEDLKATITIDAMPDRSYEGKVKKVGILPDTSNRWWNPNRKVYLTEIVIEGNDPDLKPGMSAQVRIIIDEIEDVLAVPLQAVTHQGETTICFVDASSGPVMRPVVTGDYNDSFIEIKEGLKEGERVVLNVSDLVERNKPSLDQLNKKGEVEEAAAEQEAESAPAAGQRPKDAPPPKPAAGTQVSRREDSTGGHR